jgi:hypothetical protein
MPFIEAKQVTEITFGRSANEGQSIVLGLGCSDGTEQYYSFAAATVVELVARLLSARSEAALESSASPAAMLGTSVSVAARDELVIATLHLTPVLALSFGLTPELAEELSTLLAQVAVTLTPRKPSQQN